MAQFSFPWSSIDGDRNRGVTEAAAVYGATTPTCVFEGLTAARNAATVEIAAGVANVEGRYYASTATEVITPTPSIRTTIVLRMDATDRTVTLVAKDGTSEAYPTLTKTSALYELPIALVNATVNPLVVTDARVMYSQPGTDSGWVPCTFESGFAGTAEVRKQGNVVHFRGSISTSIEAGASHTILTVPEGYRPSSTEDGALAFRPSGNMNVIAGGVNTAGTLGLRNTPIITSLWSAAVQSAYESFSSHLTSSDLDTPAKVKENLSRVRTLLNAMKNDTVYTGSVSVLSMTGTWLVD